MLLLAPCVLIVVSEFVTSLDFSFSYLIDL